MKQDSFFLKDLAKRLVSKPIDINTFSTGIESGGLKLSTEEENIDIPKLKKVVKYLESRGDKEKAYETDQYSGIKTYGRAGGAYRITEAELNERSKTFLGRKVTYNDFMKSKELQDKYMEGKIKFLKDRGYSLKEILAMHNKGMYVGGDFGEEKNKSRFYEMIMTPEEREKKIKDAEEYVNIGLQQYNI